MERRFILTIDIGTTYSKALVWDEKGTVVSEASKINEPIYPRLGWAEQVPRVWLENVQAAAKEALTLSEPTRQGIPVAAVGLTSCRDIVIPVDRRGEPLGNAILWMDIRAKEEAREIGRALGEEIVHRITGMIPGPTFPAAKILWLKRNDPDQIRHCAYFLQPRDYIFHKLTGEIMTDYSMASRTMMFDVQALEWWSPVFDLIGVQPSQFPTVTGALTSSELDSEMAAILGLDPETPVVLGGGDRQCEALGACVSQTRAMDSTGTGTNISLSSEPGKRPYHSKVVSSLHVLAGRYLMEVTINTTGLALEYIRGLFGGDETYIERLEDSLAAVPPGSNGLVVLPFFMGARSVRWNPHAAGVMFGLSFGHGRNEIIRAIMEGVAMEERTAIGVLKRMGFAIEEIVALGGGSRSPVWNQIKADVTDIALFTIQSPNVASFGAMALAAAAAGFYDGPEDAAQTLCSVEKGYRPNRDASARYKKVYELYTRLYEANEPLFDFLDGLRS